MRIVGGEFRGRSLTAPDSQTIRPTTDRVRESLFNVLMHLDGEPIEQARVLDLFAGTGALGLEAISRGARFCLFVDDGVESRGILRTNIEAFALNGRSKVFRRDATSLGPAAPHEPFDVVFADPPYGKNLGEKALKSAADNGWLAANALLVLEEASNAALSLPNEFVLFDSRNYGDTIIRLYRWNRS
ncbi:MAG: 16S rRNA (guanine(966)-N(2))-methyltransferase RsmD [Rhizobiaceae bacterium]